MQHGSHVSDASPLNADTESEPQPDQVAQLAQEVYNNDVLQLLVQNIWRFEFEVRNGWKLRCDVPLYADKRSAFCFDHCAGQEGCVTDFQQSPTAADRNEVAYSRISDDKVRGDLLGAERVSESGVAVLTGVADRVCVCVPGQV